MDGGRHFARCPRHSAVSHQRHLESLVLEYAERGGEVMQLGHAICLRSLEAHDDDDVSIELAGLEGGKNRVLIGEDFGRAPRSSSATDRPHSS